MEVKESSKLHCLNSVKMLLGQQVNTIHTCTWRFGCRFHSCDE